jgi:hypothetical protein
MFNLWVWFWLAFIGGFFTTWMALDDLGSNVVIFTSEEELQQLCWDGLRDGEKNR